MAKGKGLRILGIILIIVLLIALILFGLWYWFSRRAYPQTSRSIQVPSLENPVEVLRDEYGVAHIYADTPHDLFFAEGYVHAQERFWQMEFQRRLGKGRLSELFGEATLETDIYLRHFNFAELSKKSYQMMSDESRLAVDSYVEGVNAYISDREPPRLGLEFALLELQGTEIEIEAWQPVDTIVWAYMLIFDQSDQLHSELRNIQQLGAVGWDLYADLHPEYRDDRPVIIPGGAAASAVSPNKFSWSDIKLLEEFGERLAGVKQNIPPVANRGAADGSNGFAVSGAKTTTGSAMLANDPHMSVNMPALWYEVGLHCLEKSEDCIYEVRGFSLPGIPGILIGHTDRIAWGLTNAAFDAEDVFIERINPDNPNQYEVQGEWVDMEIRPERIKVLGREEPVRILVRSTRNGLVASDFMVEGAPFLYREGEPELYALSYAWPALQPVNSLDAVLGVLRVQDWDEFVEAVGKFEAGKQNWLYADVDGNIGYIMPGTVPVRAGGDGTLPVPGWNDDYRWIGSIPLGETPQVFNPGSGYIITANNPQFRQGDYPYLIAKEQDRGQRAQRLTDLINADSDGITLEDMAAFQTDNKSLSALEIIPYLEGINFGDRDINATRDSLLDWDAQMGMDSAQAALFNIFWKHLLEAVFHDQLSPEISPYGGHTASDIVYFLLQEPDNLWWDDVTTPDAVEKRDDILEAAFLKAWGEGVELFGEYPGEWRWGDLHTITFRNPTLGSSGIAVIEDIFNRGPYPTSGSESVIQKTCWTANDPYHVTCIPALRQVIDLGDLAGSKMIHSLGQSGHPGHRFYDNFIDPWRFFDYHPSNWERENIEAGDHDLLRMEPAG
jgi:penicillin amidase